MSKFSSGQLTGFYEVERLITLMRQLAALNIILCEEEEYRYHRFTEEWLSDVQLAEVDNGSGDHIFILFRNRSCLIKGFDHESPVSPHAQDPFEIKKDMYKGLPEHWNAFLNKELIRRADVTFCIWRDERDWEWKRGFATAENEPDDGSSFLLGTIFSNATAFKEWADDYFEMEIKLKLLEAVFSGQDITRELILGIHPNCKVEKVKLELEAKDLLYW